MKPREPSIQIAYVAQPHEQITTPHLLVLDGRGIENVKDLGERISVEPAGPGAASSSKATLTRWDSGIKTLKGNER